MKRIIFQLICLLVLPCTVLAGSTLDNCAEQFIAGNITNAPTLFNSPPDQPFGSNKHLCYQNNGVSYFALEYWPEEFAPRWTAYKITPENYGEHGCATYTRKIADCYFQEETWAGFEACTNGSDPFHEDTILTGIKLGPNDFSNTGHDRGHIAPRQAFSWDVCATYDSFTMANISPQRAFLNQNIWADLEQQVLTWGIDDGPIYVVTGTVFRKFPAERFQAYLDGLLDSSAIYPFNSHLSTIVTQHHANYDATQPGDLLRPKRDAKPDQIKQKVQKQRMPTGYYKVIYRPATGSEPAHAIGFLIPHTFENLNLLSNHDGIDDGEVYWSFASRIDLIEEASGVSFPGIPGSLKSIWRNAWFYAHKGSQDDLRGSDCGRGTPKGVLPNSTREQRIEACIDELKEK